MLLDFKLGLRDILGMLVVFQYLVIAGFLVVHKTARASGGSILATFFVLVAANVLDAILMMSGVYLSHPALALFEDSFALTYGPLIFIYTRQILGDRQHRSFDLLHFLPFVLMFLSVMAWYHSQTSEEQVNLIRLIMAQQLPVSSGIAISGLLVLHFLSYLVICVLRIRKFHTDLRESYSSLLHVNLNWLLFTIYLIATTFCISYIATILSLNGFLILSQVGLVLVLAILLFYINSFILNSMKQPRLFAATEVTPMARIRADTIPEAERKEIRGKLDILVAAKFYVNPDLNIEMLADMTGVAPRKMSQYLNEVLQQTFFDFVNRLRVAEASELLRTDRGKDLTIQQIMYNVGFRSKSSFNTVFKQITGRTPGEFRKAETGQPLP